MVDALFVMVWIGGTALLTSACWYAYKRPFEFIRLNVRFYAFQYRLIRIGIPPEKFPLFMYVLANETEEAPDTASEPGRAWRRKRRYVRIIAAYGTAFGCALLLAGFAILVGFLVAALS